MDITESLNVGLKYHRAGQLARAEEIYRQVLASQPNHPDALHWLGVVAQQLAKHGEAIKLLQRSLEFNPANAECWFNLGLALKAEGRLAEAIDAGRQVVSLRPDWAEAYDNLGSFQQDKGDLKDAIRSFNHASQLKPTIAEFQFNLGNARRAIGDLNGAVEAYRMAISRRPQFPEAFNNLGSVLCASDQIQEGIAAFQNAVSLRPQFAEAHNNLGEALRQMRRYDESTAAITQALHIWPDYPAALVNLSLVLRDRARWDDAISCCRRALGLRPNDSVAQNALGSIFYKMGNVQKAMTAWKKLVALQPGDPLAHMNYSMALLLLGLWESGWREFEWRQSLPKMRPSHGTLSNQWNGADPRGMRIFVHGGSDCGYGDWLQMIRFAPMLKQRGAEVIVECKPSLVSLFQGTPGIDNVVPEGQTPGPWDYHVPVLSLPGAFRTSPIKVPASVPYLQVPPDRIAKWRGTVPQDGKLNVGLVWAGRPRYLEDEVRSTSMALFAPLAKVPEVRFLNLQVGPESHQARTHGLLVDDPPRLIDDFADTAAFIQQLDLVISVDTAVAHLAGALGRPVWVLLAFVPGPFWMISGTECPWYPTMRLFRQSRPGDWNGVIERLAEELANLSNRHTDGPVF